ncbi:DUF4358 domain-containing protein [Caloranaerobacter azorensis]|uniref:DUF4358 domain-containing protein n=1 Tax=Caloranaerobacter azorensis TaxID=116090 RepID=UPI00068BD4FA|nr:DUF4358 domain-containing protein [Caloranaerobacter azorensis]
MKKIISLLIIVTTLFTFVGCDQQETKTPEINVSMEDVIKAVKDQMAKDMIAAGAPEDIFKDGQLPKYMEIDLTSEDVQGQIAEMFNKEDLESGIVLQHMMNVKSDLVIILKAKDKNKVENLKASLEKIKEQQEKIWSQYLPDQYEKVKNNIIKINGNYLIYITWDTPENIETAFDNAFKK